MIKGSSKRGAVTLPQSESHDEFLELCTLATAGTLSEQEQNRLQEHLASCPSCREAMQQYEKVLSTVIPALAPDDFPEDLQPGPSWSQAQAEASFFSRLEQEEQSNELPEGHPSGIVDPASADRLRLDMGDAIWRHVWIQYAAGILLIITLGLCAYEVGIRHGSGLATSQGAPPMVSGIQVEQQPVIASPGREIVPTQNERPDNIVSELRRQLAQEGAQVARLKAMQAQSENDLRNGETDRTRLLQERSNLAQQLEAAQTKVQSLQQTPDSATRQTSQEATRTAALEAKISELDLALHERDQDISRQQELLAHDRDIRDLIGARDLYIAEVYDVARTGATQKPYGRVFYTKGKSLIFYAYDLDQQSGIKNASTFQAWGRRGPDKQHAINLGIFYQDNSSQKRWVLKSNNSKTLAQIDAVFVTVEPNGGSQLPSGKQLLFAYLRIEPNHP